MNLKKQGKLTKIPCECNGGILMQEKLKKAILFGLGLATLFWTTSCSTSSMNQAPFEHPDEKEQVLVEKNKKAEDARAFVADATKQTAVYGQMDAEGTRLYQHYGAFRNTTEKVFLVEAIEATFYKDRTYKKEVVGSWETVFTKRIVEPGGVVYYQTTYPFVAEKFTYPVLHTIHFKESTEDPSLVVWDTLKLVNVAKEVGQLSGYVGVTNKKGTVAFCFIFLDDTGAVRGVVQEVPRKVNNYQVFIEKEIDTSMVNDFERITKVEVHIH